MVDYSKPFVLIDTSVHEENDGTISFLLLLLQSPSQEKQYIAIRVPDRTNGQTLKLIFDAALSQA